MSTYARIAVANSDGTFFSIYCHWDGYPSCAGKTLRDHYKDEAKVRELMSLGDLSVLGAEIGVKHDFYQEDSGMCTAYARDRGEEGVDQLHSHDFGELVQSTYDCGGKWLYVFENGKWTETNVTSITEG